MPKRTNIPDCENAGPICPNPHCKKANKKYRSLFDLRRHFSVQNECLTYHVSANKELFCPTTVEMPPDNVKIPEIARASSELHSESAPDSLESVDFVETPDCDDYETGVYSDNETHKWHDETDFLVASMDEITFTDEMRVEVSLLRLCNNMDAPLWAFEQIMEWAHDALSTGYKFIPQQSQYESQIKKLGKWLNMEHIRPIEQKIELPSKHEGKHEINVTTFQFKNQVHSLLSDPILNRPENLVINKENPFSKYEPPDGLLGECLSGSWYRNAWAHMESENLGNFLCPVILYIDKTHLSSSGKLTLFPVMMSLGIFTSKTRRHAYAWRPLGYIANESINFSKGQLAENDADTKNERFHTILECVLKSFKQAQLPGALHNIKMQLGDIARRCNLYMPLQFIIGDVEGGDMLCSRYTYRQLACKRLCRTCDVPTVEAGRTDIECNRIKVKDVKRLVDNKMLKELHEMAQRPGKNCLYDIDCGNCPYGIFSMVHSEGLHALEIGCMPYMWEILIDDIPSKYHAELDALVQRLCLDPKQRAYDFFPRSLWPDGVTSLTNLSGTDKVGKLFAITLVALTLEGQNFFIKVLPGGEETWRKMLYCFQQILCYWSWLKQDTFWDCMDTNACEAATRCIRIMMLQIQVLWPRKYGLEWNITKLHEQFHIPFDIFRHGAHSNVHTGPQEHNHIQTKRAALNTQRRRLQIDLQTAERLVDRLMIHHAYDLMTDQLSKLESYVPPIYRDGISPVSSKGTLRLIEPANGKRNCMNGGLFWDNSNYNQYHIPHQTYVMSLIHRMMFEEYSCPKLNSTGELERTLEVPFFSEYTRQNLSYRCHPHYRSTKPHYDWCYIRWQNENTEEDHLDVIGRILLFYVHPTEGLQAVVQSVDVTTETKHGVFGNYYHMEMNGKSPTSPPSLYTVSTDCLEQHAMMLRYIKDSEKVWIHIWDQSDWSNCFQDIEEP